MAASNCVLAVLLLVITVEIALSAPNKAHKDIKSITTYASGYVNGDGDVTIRDVFDPTSDVYGVYTDTYDSLGWYQLEITVNPASKLSENQIYHAVGVVEGQLTYQQVYDALQNELTWSSLANVMSSPSKRDTLLAWFTENEALSRKQVSDNPTDPFWISIGNLWAQYDGLQEGVSKAVKANNGSEVPVWGYYVLNGMGDLIDLITALNLTAPPDLKHSTKQELASYVRSHSLCSGLIRVTPGIEEVYYAHSAWFIYQMMVRIFKTYNFNLPQYGDSTTQFSSYPGMLSSLDDFYMMKGSNMAMVQTTNNIFNISLYDAVSVDKQLAWLRVRTANHLAFNGMQWGEILATENSGTYNNQYMVIDLKQIKLKDSLGDGSLVVVEQIPGLVEYADETSILNTGYWPSYNVPFFERIYNLSGYPEFVDVMGNDYSYQMAPRAKIFRREAPKVYTMQDMKSIMRYNRYESDPYSEGNACNSICCRGDLVSGSGASVDGCYDSKISSYSLFQDSFSAHIINGPTTYDGIQPFSWSNWENDGFSHLGQVDTFNFAFFEYTPNMTSIKW